MSSSRRCSLLVAAAALSTIAPLGVAVGQSISPFVSYVPSASANPLAGMALTFGGTSGLALRGSAGMSIENSPPVTDSAAGGYRPWAADADAVLFLGGLGSRAISPYVFSGIGLNGGDSAGVNVVHNGWSYGVGTTLPLGFNMGLFGEARWRMSKYVLPTSNMAPSPISEFRVGLSFHVGGGSRDRDLAPEPRRRGRRQMDDYEDVVVVAPEQAPYPVPETTPSATIINVNPPVVVQYPTESVGYPVETNSRPVETVSEPAATVSRPTGAISRRAGLIKRRMDAVRQTRERTTTTSTTTPTSSRLPGTVRRAGGIVTRSSGAVTRPSDADTRSPGAVSRSSRTGSRSSGAVSRSSGVVSRAAGVVSRSRSSTAQQKPTTTAPATPSCSGSRTRVRGQVACRR